MMKQLYPDLWQTRPEHPFGPGSATHAYLLIRSTGNVLFYSCAHSDEYRNILQLGGAVRQYLSHRDEAGAGLQRMKETLGCLLCCHTLEAAAISKACPVDLTFENRGCHLGDIEVIPTPGHTDGSTCFLCTSQQRLRYLFTGDTIFPDGDSWGTYVSAKHRRALAESLALLRPLEPDVVLSSASSGPYAFREMLPGQWPEAVDGAIRALS